MYICKYFSIQELVPPNIHSLRGEKSWELLDDRALITLDLLRTQYGSIKINDWYWGGDREWSGLRTHDSPYFSTTSQHTFGRAFDLIFKYVNAEEVRQDIINNQDKFCYINSIELNTSWLHFDTRNCNRILTYNS